MQPGEEQIPIPCSRCGAPMQEQPHVAVLAPVTVRCAFCGTTEELPGAPAERVVRLRSRLAQIRWAAQAEEGPTIALTRAIETWRGMVLPAALAISAVALASAGMQAAHALELPSGARMAVLISALTAPLHIAALFGGVTIGFLWSMRAYIADVRPRIEARPSLALGGAMRCRSCGGDLARDGHAGFVRCGHCSAENLVTENIAKEREKRLDRELRERQERAAGVALRAREGLERYQRKLYLTMGVSIGLSLAMTFGTTTLVRWLAG